MEHKDNDYSQKFKENGTRLSKCKVRNFQLENSLENNLEKTHFLSLKPLVLEHTCIEQDCNKCLEKDHMCDSPTSPQGEP